MSLLLRRISKLSLTKKPISSCFSTVTTSKSKPYLLLHTQIKENALNFNLYDPTENKEMVKNLKFEDQSETLRNLLEESWPIGSSRGYFALRNKKDSSVHLVDISNDQLKAKILSLPPLHFDKSETYLKNVSVSSPVNGDDVIVAVKFSGSRLSLCRVCDSEWTRIDVPSSFHYSTLIYSEIDERFYLNNSDPYDTDTIDFTPKSGLVTPVSGYPFPRNMAEYGKEVMTFSNSALKKQLVESPSGQSFIVCWVTCEFNKKGDQVVAAQWDDCYPMTKEKTQRIVVYKQDEEQEICSYTVTKDIGDLCIFIGANEPFCVSASDYSDLKPNSVYFAGHGSDFGVCDLSSQTILHFSENVTPFPYFFMFWIPPTPTLAS